ncbi:hypothetical protein BMF94_2232 [Rhodotorula taiwanensis]|uniref:Uncharacterized protein n=1 Tax=Rhodotorula taiwanensis TaxID=741276 RepID=A0A2S5BD99_9BASI|nr:hypothetical protein BMF94_2232 [Rhodotorula taiwanensis]
MIIESWQARYRFQREVELEDLGAKLDDSLPSSPRIEKKAPPKQGAALSPRRLSAPSLQGSLGPQSFYRYLGHNPAVPEWTAGFWACAFAFLAAVAPRFDIRPPSFSREEIYVLSFSSNSQALPRLSDQTIAPGQRHIPTERLAVEHIYHTYGHLTVNQTRQVLLTERYPDLMAYVKIVAKIYMARDAFCQMCDDIVNQELCALRDSPEACVPC